MKSYRVAVLILACLVFMSVYLYIYVQKSAGVLTSQAEAILRILSEDDEITDDVTERLDKLSNDVNKEFIIWDFIINQSETEKALCAMNACIGYSKTKTSSDVIYSLYQFCFYIDNIVKRETVSFSNII